MSSSQPKTLTLSHNRDHTIDEYPEEMIVVRRGNSLTIKDSLPGKLQLKGRVREIPEDEGKIFSKDIKWRMIRTGNDLNITVPENTPIGRYSITLNNNSTTVFYIICNPWNKNDTTYYENKEELSEYILGQFASSQILKPDWDYDQFDRDVIYSVFRFIDTLPYEMRADPIEISRMLTDTVNANLLAGNWDNKPDTLTKVNSWKRSGDIFTKYVENPKKLVEFGQCFTFSAMLTTMCRCIGIPSRSLKNEPSAHDSGFDRGIDKVIKDGKVTAEPESVWNFHEWNEVWFARPDLKNTIYEKAGWQAIDGTPQEQSNETADNTTITKTYACGPCPVEAIRRGDRVPFDMEFIFSEVNGTERLWWDVTYEGKPFKILYEVNFGLYGNNIPTKICGKDDTCNLNQGYKGNSRAEQIAAYEKFFPFSFKITKAGETETHYNFDITVDPNVDLMDKHTMYVYSHNQTLESIIRSKFPSENTFDADSYVASWRLQETAHLKMPVIYHIGDPASMIVNVKKSDVIADELENQETVLKVAIIGRHNKIVFPYLKKYCFKENIVLDL